MATLSASSVSSSDATVMGNKRVWMGRISTTISDGDVLVIPGMNRIDVAVATNSSTKNAGNDLELSWATNVITFSVAGTVSAAAILVFGN